MSSAREVVIVAGVRTPFAKAGSKLKSVHAADLGTTALKELIADSNIDVTEIDEVIIGNTGSPSDAVNISRVVALSSGLPNTVSAATTHRNCASALESICNGYDKIRAGSADVIVAGGTESMSQMPVLMPDKMVDVLGQLGRAKTMGKQLGALGSLLKADLNQIKEMATTPPMKATPYKPRIAIVEGLTDPFCGLNMGETAEVLAKEFGISRGVQDEFALNSHQKAVKAWEEGILAEEVTPVFIPPKYKDVVSEDIGPRKEQTMEQLGKLRPFFDRKYGSITVGNACPITDGAAMVLLMSREKAESLGYKPLAKIRSYAFAGLEPERMGLGPVYSSPKALDKAGLQLKDMDLVELNEAFAAQVLACVSAFGSKSFGQEKLGRSDAVGELDPNKLNVNGGAIAIGHPVGATGTRLVLTLMKEMKRRNNQFGLATLCIGGGQGGAIVLENEA